MQHSYYQTGIVKGYLLSLKRYCKNIWGLFFVVGFMLVAVKTAF